MDNQIFDTVTEWDTASFGGGYDGLNNLADAGFSGAIKTESTWRYDEPTWAFMLDGYVIGVVDGSIAAFNGADGTVYKASNLSLPLLYTMECGDSEKQAEYYTKDTAISKADDTLSSGNFTGYIKLSENVHSGDYYIVYYGGRSMSVAFVGPNRTLFTGDEAFERANDEIGIYEVYATDINIVDIPGSETTTTTDTAGEEAQNNGNNTQPVSDDTDSIDECKGKSDILIEELTEQKEWFGKIKDQLQIDSSPATIPSIPRLSLAYDDIKKSNTIGRGGNADVYRAKATAHSDEITLAIKEPRMSGTIDSERINELIDEAQTWQQLDGHDYIVSVIDYGSTPLPWIGMEYMDGGDLSERAGEVSFDQAIWTALAITKGVRYAHKQGVAHFDLKPTNILFRSVNDAWDVPKIADWGLSKNLLEHSKSVEGLSPRYAAPEQFDSRQFGQTDNVTDVYQLGTVLYELFTGKPPYEGQPYEVMNRKQSTTPVPPSESADLPEAVDDIILTALAKKKADRYDDVIYLRDALQELWEEYS